MRILRFFKPSQQQKKLPPPTDPLVIYEITEEVIVHLDDKSPVDLLAQRISQEIVKNSLCEIKTTDLGSPYRRYSVSVKIAMKRK